MKSIISTALLFLGLGSAIAQEYSDFIDPIRLSDNINTESEEIYPLTYGKELYFVRSYSDNNIGGEDSGHDVWKSVKTNTGRWQKATNDLSTLNTDKSNAVLGISSNGNKYYLMNLYETDSSIAGVSVSYRIGDSDLWTHPDTIKVKGLNPQTRYYGVYVDPEDEVMFVSMEADSTLGLEDLFVAEKDDQGNWDSLTHLASISSDGFDMSPFLAPDRRTLFFSSDREGGIGDADIYSVERVGDSWTEWGEPKNLGSVINSEGFDAYFSIYADSTAYFSSDRNGNADIYETELVGKKDTERLANEAGDIIYKFNRSNYVYFDFDEYVIKPSMKNFLNDVIEKLNEDELRTITLEGHTDYKGSEEYNKELGMNRALSVKKYLIEKGVSEDKIETISYGESKPQVKALVNGKDVPEARAQNRRVRIKIETQNLSQK